MHLAEPMPRANSAGETGASQVTVRDRALRDSVLLLRAKRGASDSSADDRDPEPKVAHSGRS